MTYGETITRLCQIRDKLAGNDEVALIAAICAVKQQGGNFPTPTDEQRQTLADAIQFYGKESQIDMAIEEMSELTKALLKHRRMRVTERFPDNEYDLRGMNVDIAKSDIHEEMADVIIILHQMLMIFDDPVAIQNYIDKKIDRLAKRMKKDERVDKQNNQKGQAHES